MKFKILSIIVTAVIVLGLAAPALANPPYPETTKPPVTVQPPGDVTLPLVERMYRAKAWDQPNVKDYLRNRERQRLLEAGQTAEANALSLKTTDRVLVILVEFAGTDVFTWQAGVSAWDPLGRANPDEYNGVAPSGVCTDCNRIITQTQTFTYTGPLHNQIPRPISATDRSGDTIWTEDFSPQWFYDFMFGNGVTFHYTRTDGSLVHLDFTGKSVKHYYQDLSDGDYTIDGDVIGWLQLPHSTWWYGADGCPGARSVPDGVTRPASAGAIPGAGSARSLVRDALDAVNAISNTIPGFSWANYDLDHDGIIDRLWIVHAGYGEEDSTVLLNRTDYGEAALWSHSSALTPAYYVGQGVSAGPYIMMPENGGIGVFAHEYGHNLGADDLYAYGAGNTSAGFWTLMSDDWTGYPIGFEPPAVDPWHLDNWGWLHPYIITNTAKVYTITLGQASDFPGGAKGDMYRGAKIVLPEGTIPLPVPVWQGSHYWWGGHKDLSNAMMTTKNPLDLTTAATATLSFDLVYDIEDEWDFLWVQVSEDGVTWNYADTLTNANTQCDHDPSWIGGLYGFPDDLCAAGIGGFYGSNANWPNPENQVFDLSAYVGKSIYLRFWYMTDWGTLYSGAFVDNVKVETNSGVIFTDNAESGDAHWNYQAPWVRSDGTMPFTHNFYLQWRNVNTNGGYDEALGESRWRFGPANTGLLVWYNNNFYTDNEIWTYLFDDPSIGPKGRMLVLDAHPEPYRDPDLVAYGFDNEGGNLTSRGQMRDAPFTLVDTVSFTHTDPYRSGAQSHSYTGRPAEPAFHDSLGYYPGAEYVRRGPAYPTTQFKWVTSQWDTSGVTPARSPYPLNAVGYDGTAANPNASDREFRFRCTPLLTGPNAGFLSCYWLGTGTGLGYQGGTGNPGDYAAQYGWHVKLIEEAADHTWATVRIWNAMKAFDDALAATPTSAIQGSRIDYAYTLNQNVGSPVKPLVIIPLPASVQYIAGSATGGAIPLPVGMPTEQVAAIYAEGGQAALQELAVAQGGEVGAIAWTGNPVGTGQGGIQFGFSVKAVTPGAVVALEAQDYDGAVKFQSTYANPVKILYGIYLPLVVKE